MESRTVHPLIKELNAISRGERTATPEEIKALINSIQIVSEHRQKEIAECKDLIAKHPNLKIAIPEQFSLDSTNLFGETALMVAAANNNKGVVHALLDAKADINAQDNKGLTALMHAKDYPEMVGLLINLKADANIKNNKGETALVCALHSLVRFEETIIKLIEVTDPNIKDKEGNTALIGAIKAKRLLDVPKLIDAKNAPLNAQDTFGDTALILAIKNGYWEIAQHLIRVKADVQIKGLGEATALTWAIELGQLGIVDTLLEEKAHVNVQEKSGATPLILAAPFSPILKRVIEEKAELDVQDNKGNTALMYAVLTSLRSVEHLIKAKANLELKNKEGFSALMLAAQKVKVEEGLALLDAGAHAHPKTQQPSALMLAISAGHTQLVSISKGNCYYANTLIQRLIEETKDKNELNETDSEGNSLLILALKRENPVAALKLIQAKADPHVKNKKGETAFHLVVQFVNADVMKELIKQKVNVDLNEVFYGETALTLLIKKLNNFYYASDSFLRNILSFINELVLAKVDVNKPNLFGDTPLTLAVADHQHPDLVHTLLNAGADPNNSDANGDTPLIRAVKNRHYNIAYDILNQRKADTERVNSEGKTALDIALDKVLETGYYYRQDDNKANIAMVSLLLSKGAKITKNNLTGWRYVFQYYYDSRDPAVLTIIRELCNQVKNSPLVNSHPYKEPYRAALAYLVKLDELTEIHRNKAALEVGKAIGNTLFKGVIAMCPPADTKLEKEEKGDVEAQKIISLIAKYDAPLEEPRLGFFPPDKLGDELDKARASIGQKSCTIL